MMIEKDAIYGVLFNIDIFIWYDAPNGYKTWQIWDNAVIYKTVGCNMDRIWGEKEYGMLPICK